MKVLGSRLVSCLSAALLTLLLAGSARGAETGERSFDCTIEPRRTAMVGSFEEGVLEEIAVERGDIVSQGQLLASMEARTERLTADRARLQAEQDVEIRSREARLAFQAIQTQRIGQLVSRKLASDQELDEARIEERLATLEVESARFRNDLAVAELALAQAGLDRRRITSPLDAIVTEVLMAPGEYINEQKPLLVLAAIEQLNVEVFVPVADYGRIAPGQEAIVEPVQPIGGRYRAAVEVVDRVFDAASGTFGVRLLLENRDLSLPAGIRCRVRFAAD